MFIVPILFNGQCKALHNVAQGISTEILILSRVGNVEDTMLSSYLCNKKAKRLQNEGRQTRAFGCSL